MTYAPLDAEYLTLAANGSLTDYRILNIGNMLVAVDGGPAGNYTLNVDPTQIDHADLDNLTAGDPHTQYMLGTILSANGDILIRASGVPDNLPIGSTGDVLTVASGLPSWAAPAAAPTAPLSAGFITGRYYTQPFNGGILSTFGLVANRLYLTPFAVGQTQTFDEIAIQVTAFVAGNARLGIYGPFTGDYSSIPLVLDAGTVSTGTNGFKSISISQQLTPGWYLLAIVSDATATIRGITTAGTQAVLGRPDLSTAAGDSLSYYAFTYGTLPSPSTGSPTFATGTIPVPALRAA